MAERKNPRPKRVPKNISLPPELDKQLAVEAEARLLNESIIIERALIAFFREIPPVIDAPPSPAPTSK